ncbi:peptidyl-prolyl cis-trans isomerase [Candidatus Woesearchaeota archaeon]|nr:peptidyl-prolyl cis-trans isomerase [Candidatus Woesearchaeota archaeon]MBW3005831.1 peptidyl-prolyl cis-trans isomerase [Candidatus Woesearchaeota archaeon]
MKKILLILTILLVLTACAKPVEKQEPVKNITEEPAKNMTEEKNITAEEPAKNETVEKKQEEPVKNETVKEQKVETMAKKVHAKHILVKTEEEANAILYDLNHGKDFDEIAKEKSMCPSGKKGGDLGWFGKGMMVKEFETAAFSLKKDELSKPVKTQFGWHIIKVIEKE